MRLSIAIGDCTLGIEESLAELTSIIVFVAQQPAARVKMHANDGPSHRASVLPTGCVAAARVAKNLPNLLLRHPGLQQLQFGDVKWRTIELPKQQSQSDSSEQH